MSARDADLGRRPGVGEAKLPSIRMDYAEAGQRSSVKFNELHRSSIATAMLRAVMD